MGAGVSGGGGGERLSRYRAGAKRCQRRSVGPRLARSGGRGIQPRKTSSSGRRDETDPVWTHQISTAYSAEAGESLSLRSRLDRA